MFQWARATTRLIQWGWLGGVVAATLALSAILAMADVAFPVNLTPVVAAAVAAAVPASLDDPASGLLAPVATSCRRRLAHRLVIVVPASVVCWSVVASLVDHGERQLSTFGPMAALAAVGVATTCIVRMWRPDVSAAAGAAAPLALASGSAWIPVDRVAVAAAVWSVHPWPVIAIGAAVAVIGADRSRPPIWSRRRRRPSCPAT